jgi:hypothetical protein
LADCFIVIQQNTIAMDRRIAAPKHKKLQLIKEFEYLDLFPYSIALLMISGSIYILSAFIAITHALKQF